MMTAKKTSFVKDLSVDHQKFYQETTFHALSYFGTSTGLKQKLLWLVALIAGLVALIWSTQILLLNFLISPTKVTVEVLTPLAMPLPEITVCSLRRINKTKADYIGLNTSQSVGYLYGSFASLSGFMFSPEELKYFQENINVSSVHDQYFAAYEFWKRNIYIDNDPSVALMLKYLSQKCIPHETFTCVIGGRRLDDCCAQIDHFRNYNGPCFRFSFLQEAENQQHVGGIREGLIALFEPPAEEVYVKSVFNVFTDRGLQMFFDPYEAGIELNPILLSEGWEYAMSLEMRDTKLLNTHGQGNCTSVKYKVDNVTVSDPYPYCTYVCLSELFAHTCGCKPINNLFMVETHERYCGPEDVVACVLRHSERIRHLNPLACGQKCQYACHQRQYILTSTAIPLNPVPMHARNLPTRNSRAIKFSVYFPRIQYVSFEEIDTTSWFSFISNVGGCLGLWTGASVASILHCLIYIYKRSTTKKLNQIKEPAKNNKEISMYTASKHGASGEKQSRQTVRTDSRQFLVPNNPKQRDLEAGLYNQNYPPIASPVENNNPGKVSTPSHAKF